MSVYAHVLTENADYTAKDFAEEIKKSYDINNPVNKHAVDYLLSL